MADYRTRVASGHSGHVAPGIYGATQLQQDAIRAGLELFRASGLQLPKLRIYVHDSMDGCDGWRGMFNADGSGHRIDLCGDVLLHELAHVWEFHEIDDATRQEFLQFTNLDVWHDAAVSHAARGAEHAANAIAWGVGHQGASGELHKDGYLADRYELLTGKQPGQLVEPLSDHQTDMTGELSIYGTDAESETLIRATAAQLASYGFRYPRISIHVHRHLAACDGFNGLFGKGGDLQRVDICLVEPFVIRHELAHVWERHNLSDAARESFLEKAGLTVWNDQSVPHHLRGIERVAEVIAWGTSSQPIQPSHCYRCEDDLALYELLTGRSSPRIAHDSSTKEPREGPPTKPVVEPTRQIAVVG